MSSTVQLLCRSEHLIHNDKCSEELQTVEELTKQGNILLINELQILPELGHCMQFVKLFNGVYRVNLQIIILNEQQKLKLYSQIASEETYLTIFYIFLF